ncbi:unnamed protein product [Vitrella brassicaformis CCMP3155]|uniref:Uncharacterized protein n=1 Tax=Vitrella brassicaformis (strain CCMP3155) TaxID=1169540 RepID=A0A0G4GNK7_VITBC|nr:unnamed protein product [Vitrella brassicaformis CCMP3155]|eukprot:CEM31858.1 unnamed protein product [Vitrella brassicaformis CCMP3155]
MDSSHDAPTPSRGGRGDLSDDSLRDVIDQIQSIASEMAAPARRARELIQRNQHNDTQVCASAAGRRLLGFLTNLTDTHSALSNELTQTPTNHNKHKRRMDVDGGASQWGAGGAVGPKETDSNKQHSNEVPADDGGAKKRGRIDISHTAAAAADGGGDRDGHSGGGSAKGLFGAPQLWQRLSHSLGTQAGLRRTANGQQLLTFADQQQMGVADLLAALCVMEAGGWSEMSEAIELAGQCGNCQLPVRLTAADLHQYPNKAAYSAAPRVLAQLKMVGPHIHFGDGVTFQLFQHGNRLRAIKDQIGLEIDINPPLPANHPIQQHRQLHDPPVHSNMTYVPPLGWMSLAASRVYSSVSSFVKRIAINHFAATHQYNKTSGRIDRDVDNSRLITFVTQSSHTPVEGCTTTSTSYRSTDGFTYRRLVLTDASHSFVA